MDRRQVLKASVWSVPVIAASIAVPGAAASVERVPVGCEYLQNNGHGGVKGGDWWQVTYNDGSSQILDNGTVQSDKALKALCGKKVHS